MSRKTFIHVRDFIGDAIGAVVLINGLEHSCIGDDTLNCDECFRAYIEERLRQICLEIDGFMSSREDK